MWLVLSLVSVGIFKSCVNVESIVRIYCSLMRDDNRFCVAQFMQDSILLHDTAHRNSGCYTILSRLIN